MATPTPTLEQLAEAYNQLQAQFTNAQQPDLFLAERPGAD